MCFSKKMSVNVVFPVFSGLCLVWSVGFLLCQGMGCQLISGVLFSLNLNCMGITYSLTSKVYVFVEVWFGWFTVMIHFMFPYVVFLLMFLHVFSVFMFPFYYFSLAWMSGFVLYILTMGVGFTGYSLICGSMGYWALVVAGGMLEVLSGVISEMVFTDLNFISNSVVMRLYSYHFIIGLSLVFFMGLHIFLNHLSGCSYSYSFYLDLFPFVVFMVGKDVFMLQVLEVVLSWCVCFFPESFISGDSYMEVNVFVVPEDINAEWYLSIFFVMLKVMFSKLYGVLLVLGSLMLMFFKFYNKGMLGFSGGEFHWLGFLILMLEFDIVVVASFFYGGGLVVNLWLLGLKYYLVGLNWNVDYGFNLGVLCMES